MKVNKYQIKIESVVYGGSGLGRREDGKIVFVKGVLPGEVVIVEEKKEKNDFIKAKLIKVLSPSPERIESNCLIPVGYDGIGNACYAKTPGCVYQEFSYKEELRVKNEQFADFMGDEVKILPHIPAPKQLNYRNKIVFHVTDDHGDISLGYNEEQGHEVIDMESCPLAHPAINDKLRELRMNPGFKKTIREGMSFTLRFTQNDGVLHWRNSPPSNASWLKEQTPVGTLSVPPGSFFQVNPDVSDILVEKVKTIIENSGCTSLVDLYCGCGLFSITALSAGLKNVTGLDNDKASIKAAEFNASGNKEAEADFIAGDADKLFQEVLERHKQKTNGTLQNSILLADPPRSGLGRKIKYFLKDENFGEIIYVSCAPDTLKRDILSLKRAGYNIKSAQMLDMFPRTAHFESLVHFTREG